MTKKTKYEKSADNVKEFCSDIEWELSYITDILDARDYVEISPKMIKELSEISAKVQRMREEIDKANKATEQ